jgi:hypothetical protein
MLVQRLNRPRILLPLIHTVIAAILILQLYGPQWRRNRRSEREYQERIDTQAREGKWHPGPQWFFPCEGVPKEIIAFMLPDLPSMLVAGWGVVPCISSTRLQVQEPGRLLPSTRQILWCLPFLLSVGFQWYLVGIYAESAKYMLGRALLWWIPLLWVALQLGFWKYLERPSFSHGGIWLSIRMFGMFFWPIAALLLTGYNLYQKKKIRTASN